LYARIRLAFWFRLCPAQDTGMKITYGKKLRVFIPFAIGYFLSYLYRTVNAVIAPDLTSELSLNPAQLGLLTAAYFITFAAFQLPLGVLLDRFGPRRIESILLIFAAIGALLFSRAENLPGLIVGRALVGLGVSACLMAAFKAFVLWFPSQQWPRINGLQMASGGLGALTATAPVEFALGITNWRGIFLVLAITTLAVAAVIYCVVPERKEAQKTSGLKEQLQGVLEVFLSSEFWRVAPLTTLSQASFLSIQSLWAGPWLRDVAGMERMAVAKVLLLIATAMVAGFILLGTAAERLSRRRISPLLTAAIGMMLFMGVQLLIVLEIKDWAIPLWICFGFVGTTGIISYAGLCQEFPQHLTGRVTTGLNLLVFILAFFAQWAIGAIINLFPVSADGRYATAGYKTGFGMMFALQVLSFLWFLGASIMRRRKLVEF